MKPVLTTKITGEIQCIWQVGTFIVKISVKLTLVGAFRYQNDAAKTCFFPIQIIIILRGYECWADSALKAVISNYFFN